MQKCKNVKMQKCNNENMQKYKNIKIQQYNNKKIKHKIFLYLGAVQKLRHRKWGGGGTPA